MERVRKTFFNPLARSKERIREILQDLPVGSAHPYSPERILLCRTENGIAEIDISSYPDDYFFNAVDLDEMGQILLRRMAGFQDHLKVFEDYQIMQAPASTFKIPVVTGSITILAVSERTPTYYDFCFADAQYNACCWLARETFDGILHSGDILNGQDLLDYVKIYGRSLTHREICVFISGYRKTHITQFLGTHPALLVADNVDKILYIIPVPLDTATIGDATICCPLVIKRDADSLICSILPKATTDRDMMCHSNTLQSAAFPEAIARADFTITASEPTTAQASMTELAPSNAEQTPETLRDMTSEGNAVIMSNGVTCPSFIESKTDHVIHFGTGLDFKFRGPEGITTKNESSVVLPCIFGSQLQGPVLLATGMIPSSSIPFTSEKDLRSYYEKLKNVVVIVNDQMTDNARNLASSYRMNAIFIVQLRPKKEPEQSAEVLALMDAANINAVTALAGPQSLIVVQIGDKFYFYRGIANREHLNTSGLAFGSDITSTVTSMAMDSLLDPRVPRIVDLDGDESKVILPTSGQFVKPQDLQKLFSDLPIEKVNSLTEDISAAVPQLQMLLNQKDLSELSKNLVMSLSNKVSQLTAPAREAYVEFLSDENNLNMTDPEVAKKKSIMLGDLRKRVKETQTALAPVISSLANMISNQTTSKRTHDLKRLARQTQIQGNVQAAESMTFETLGGYLEAHAAEMGVMLLNIETAPYKKLLNRLDGAIDAGEACELDSRILHLEGFDAGIIIEQSQSSHDGPLQHQSGPDRPTMALPYLSQGKGYYGSMLAWVCWDEFVNLPDPYAVRWMEKCNEAHVAALRIIMRDTLSKAIASREHNLEPGDPRIGQLMSALLMAAMSKLAAMKTSVPAVTEKAEDTVTRLMRGLFGNLMTIAGSGVRPMSMVWQLFGVYPNFEIPTTDIDWTWYERVVALYPYTAWRAEQLHENLQRFLDKVIVRVITKNENTSQVKSSSVARIGDFVRLRNVQLEHSRTIITVLMRMLTTKDVDVPAVARRLLKHLPRKLQRQTGGYTRMIKYLKDLSLGKGEKAKDNIVIVNTYTKRSAVFAELKAKAADAFANSDWDAVKDACQKILDKHAEIAALWNVDVGAVKVQSLHVYKYLLGVDNGQNTELSRRVLGDAERLRVPWRVGNEGQPSAVIEIEPLDEAFVHEMLTGEKIEPGKSEDMAEAEDKTKSETATEVVKQQPPSVSEQIARHGSGMQSKFIDSMQKDLTAEDVCHIISVPVTAMRAFTHALNRDFVWEDLGENFKEVVVDLLRNRSNREGSRPVKRLLNIGGGQKVLPMRGAA